MTEELTDKQRRFIEEYLVDLNATQAAIRASYSEDSARSIGCENLTKPYIQDAIAAARKTLALKADISAERVLKEYAKLAFLDIRKAFDESGNLKSIHELDDDTAAAISGIEVDVKSSEVDGDALHTSRIHKLKLSDKKAALDSIGRHLGMFTDRTELSGPNGAPISPSAVSVTITPDLVKSIVQQVRDDF